MRPEYMPHVETNDIFVAITMESSLNINFTKTEHREIGG